MDRFIIDGCDIALAKKITITLINRPTTEENKKVINVYTNDLISLLYAECMADVGKDDKVYRGRVLDIVYEPAAHIRSFHPNTSYAKHSDYLEVLPYNMINISTSCEKKLVGQGIDWSNIFLKLDISTAHNSEIKLFRLLNILDINDIDYKYELDNPKPIKCNCGLTVEESIDMDPIKGKETIIKTIN